VTTAIKIANRPDGAERPDRSGQSLRIAVSALLAHAPYAGSRLQSEVSSVARTQILSPEGKEVIDTCVGHISGMANGSSKPMSARSAGSPCLLSQQAHDLSSTGVPVRTGHDTVRAVVCRGDRSPPASSPARGLAPGLLGHNAGRRDSSNLVAKAVSGGSFYAMVPAAPR